MWTEVIESAEREPFEFDKSVEVALRVTVNGQALYVPGDHIEQLELELRIYGYAGVVRFWVFDDSSVGGDWTDNLQSALSGLDQITVEVVVRAYWSERELKGNSIRAISIKALVGERSMREIRDTGQSGRHHRAYMLRFYDPAYLLWRQHFPSELYTQKTMKDVIAAHTPEQFTVNVTSTVATTAMPLIFLGHSPDVNGSASFYDFLIWYTDTNNLVFYYDYTKQEYNLVDAKPQPGTPVSLDHTDLDEIEQLFAEVPRIKPRIINVCVAAAQSQPQENAQAITPLYQDYLLRSKVAQDVENRGTLETKRLYIQKAAFTMTFARLPVRLLMPGDFIDVTSESQWKDGGVVLPDVATQEKCRARRVRLSLRNRRDTSKARAKDALGRFTGSLVVEFEPQSETIPSLPDYVTPTYPRQCEGQILVDGGADNEEIYQILSDQNTGVENYRVAIPTWANQEIHAPFDAHQQPGHFYFPAYKHETVLVDLYFDSAMINCFVDWKVSGTPLPKETQGNHLLLGKTADNNTSIRHIYEDNKPVFSIQRTNQKDLQTVLIKEGYLLIHVREDSGDGGGS